MPLIPCSARSVTLTNAVARPSAAPTVTATSDREQDAVRVQRDVVSAERAEQHDPVDAEVEHAASLPERLAERGEQERCGELDARRDRRGEDRGGEERAHALTSARRRARRRTISVETTKITTRPFSATIRSDGHVGDDLHRVASDEQPGEDERRDDRPDRAEAAEERDDDPVEAGRPGEARSASRR